MEHIISKLSNELNAIEQSDGLSFPSNWNFFKDDPDGHWVICHLNYHSSTFQLFINSFFLPKNLFPKKCNKNLIKADFSVVQGWGIYGNGGSDLYLEHPLYDKPSPLNKGEPIFFARRFMGYPKGEESYFELNQKLSTSLDLHWNQGKKAYCILDAVGDLVPQVLTGNNGKFHYLLIRRNTLDKYLSITKNVVIRFFECHRIEDNYPSSFEEQFLISDPHFYFKKSFSTIDGAKKDFFIRGYDLVEKKRDYREIERDEFETVRGAALKFIIQDIKHGGNAVTIELAQENLASYYEESNKPLEMSPVYFNSSVLQKYKDDPYKYALDEMSISCRGGWSLHPYDFNKQGQLYTYAIYLTQLPAKELSYWHSFNEEPKGVVSKRSVEVDFGGNFYEEPEPINELKKALNAIWDYLIQPENEPIWKPHDNDFERTFFNFHCVATDNYQEWQRFIQDLSRIVNEGLSKQVIKKISNRIGCYDEQLGSIRLLEKCLKALSLSEEDVDEIIIPLIELQDARSNQTKAHRPRKKMPVSSELRKDAMERLDKVTNSVNSLFKICSEGKLNGQRE